MKLVWGLAGNTMTNIKVLGEVSQTQLIRTKEFSCEFNGYVHLTWVMQCIFPRSKQYIYYKIGSRFS